MSRFKYTLFVLILITNGIIINIKSTNGAKMAIPKMMFIEVTTMQYVLDSNKGNERATSEELGINRGTLRKMIADGRDNVVLINKDNTYTLLK